MSLIDDECSGCGINNLDCACPNRLRTLHHDEYVRRLKAENALIEIRKCIGHINHPATDAALQIIAAVMGDPEGEKR